MSKAKGGANTAELSAASKKLPAWASTPMRIDPYHLPHSIRFGSGATQFNIDRNGAVMRSRLSCGLDISMALPARCFEGVAARAVEFDDGRVTVTLELKHRDPALSVPLLVAHDLDDIAADWHAWSRVLQLPMLIVDSELLARPIATYLGKLMVNPAIARRKRWLKRRPFFLRRRKTGVVGEIKKISGEELVARR
jgi:hypothetical protein